MVPCFGDPAFIEHDDAIGAFDCRETMCDEEYRALAAQPFDGLLYGALGLGV